MGHASTVMRTDNQAEESKNNEDGPTDNEDREVPGRSIRRGRQTRPDIMSLIGVSSDLRLRVKPAAVRGHGKQLVRGPWQAIHRTLIKLTVSGPTLRTRSAGYRLSVG